MTFLQALLARPAHLTPLSRYTIANGAFYLAFGLTLYAWPQAANLLGAAPYAADQDGLVRLVGFCVALIGWFYVFGGRGNTDAFGLSTVADRLLVPLFVLPLGLTGAVDLGLVLPLAILDPLLGLGAYAIWRRQQAPAPVTA